MLTIRPLIGAANTFTVGKLTKQLKEKNIPYNRVLENNFIKIKYQNNDASYMYAFDSTTAKIRFKSKKSKNIQYKTTWDEGRLSISIFKSDTITKIEKNITHTTQSFWNKLFHRKKQPYTLTEISKNISDKKNSNGWTKRIYEFKDATFIDLIPHHTFKIKRNGVQTRLRNATDNDVNGIINYEINRNN